jgi:hypothetical protein
MSKMGAFLVFLTVLRRNLCKHAKISYSLISRRKQLISASVGLIPKGDLNRLLS